LGSFLKLQLAAFFNGKSFKLLLTANGFGNTLGEIITNSFGTDVMILKIFSPKNLAKILAFLTQNKASFCKNCDHNIGF
jgi:hypothetical protein